MAQRTLAPEPQASSISSALAAVGLTLVTASLVAGIVLSTDALDVREGSRTMAWLFPVAIAGIGALLTAVILRFDSILASLRLRIGAMRDHLPDLIDTNQGEVK
jgi:hypothetical protein